LKNIRFGVLRAVTMKDGVFWIATPCSSERARRFGGTWRLHLQGWKVSQARNQQKLISSLSLVLLVTYLAYFSALKMEATCSFESSVEFQQICTRRYIPEDRTLLIGFEVPTAGAVKSRALLAACFMEVSCLACTSTPKMKAICCSETSVDFQRTTRLYIPDRVNLIFMLRHCFSLNKLT
jgi:hypothetical protein